MDGLDVLRLRHYIVELEFLTSQANNDLAMYGKWQCNYEEARLTIESDIKEILEKEKIK